MSWAPESHCENRREAQRHLSYDSLFWFGLALVVGLVVRDHSSLALLVYLSTFFVALMPWAFSCLSFDFEDFSGSLGFVCADPQTHAHLFIRFQRVRASLTFSTLLPLLPSPRPSFLSSLPLHFVLLLLSLFLPLLPPLNRLASPPQ